MKKKYSVVIVTYNRLNLLKECISAVQNQTLKVHEIIIVNNCSTDGTTQYLTEISILDKTIIVYNMKKNLGGAGGFSYAIAKIGQLSDYTLIIDDDAIISSDYLEMIDISMSPNILAYSGVVKTDNIIDTSHRRRITNSTFMTKKDVDILEYDKKDYFDYDLATFCGLLVDSKLIRKIGLPKKEYFIWYDDTEYSLRIRRTTLIRNVNSAILIHKTKLNTNTALSWKSYYGYRNAWDMGKIYSSHPIIFIFYRLCFHICRIFQYFAYAIFKKKKQKYYVSLIKMHKRVIYDCIHNKLGENKMYLPSTEL